LNNIFEMADNPQQKPSNLVEKSDEDTFSPDSLEGLLSQLSQQINTSDWLKQNTPEKFAAENPEVAKAFQDVASEKK